MRARRRPVALRYKQLSEIKRGRSAWHTLERVTPYGALLIITQICSSFTGRQHTSRAFAYPRRYTCNTCRACPFSYTLFRSFSPSLLAFSLFLSGTHSNRYNFADLRSDLCICHGPFVKSASYTRGVPNLCSLSIVDFILNFKLIQLNDNLLFILLVYVIYISGNQVLN